MKAINHKCIVTAQPFSSRKVYSMYDHEKPTIRVAKLDNIILHLRTNDLNSAKD